MSDRPIVSVIIPAFGRTDMLRKAVVSALAQDLEADNFEVIVVDSSSDNGNVELIAELQQEARCQLRCFHKNPEGPGPSRNLGAKEARGEYLAFMDSDCQASPGWLREGLSKFEDGVGIVQGRIIPDPGVPHSVFNRSIEVQQESWIYQTANIFYSRKAFEQTCGFIRDRRGDRENRFVGAEDVDLAWKVKRAGWKSQFAERALVMHAVVRMPVWRWFIETRIGAVPLVVGAYPELRRFFYARYFFDQTQALLVLAIASCLVGLFFPWAWCLVLPYVVKRVSEPSKTLKGPGRLLRAALYFPRDVATLGALLAGSIRYRALLL
jgi:glycosyltransferase involved in cell wall biosynthesis